MGDKVGENPAALRAAVFLLSAKNRRGGGCSNTPPPAGRRLKKASKGGHPSSEITEPDSLAHFFILPFVKKVYLSWRSDDYHWKEQRLDYKIGK